MAAKDIHILVNSTDSFEDCWDPFFTLFAKYWPEFTGKIYINTENKVYQHDGLNIVPICSKLTKSSWSASLINALDVIDADTILYLQEDYFFHRPVSNEAVQHFYSEFLKLDIDCLHLTDQCTSGPLTRKTNQLMQVQSGAPYFASTQAAFWKSNVLKSIIRHWETGWEFEKYGSRRAAKLDLQIYCVNPDIYGVGKKKEIVPYILTGIIKGRWNPIVEKLFQNHGIQIDFSIRGFNSQVEKSYTRKLTTFLRIGKSEIRNMIYSLTESDKK